MKRSLFRLFVALLALFLALTELAIRLVQLATLAVNRATKHLEDRPKAKAARIVGAIQGPVLIPLPVQVQENNVVESRLINALTGPSLGFPVRSARAFAATVRDRLAKEPIDVLVREGIAHLSVAA